jgi:phytoene synthase
MRHIGRMLSAMGQMVRRHDPDRFFCTLFAPEAKREALFSLYAFNHELARAGEVAREPGLALIRLQWWREVVEGAARRHEVATPLRSAIAAGALPEDALLSMIEAREAAVQGVTNVEAWREMQLRGPGALAVAAAYVLHVDRAAYPRLRALGAGCGVAGSLRNALAGHGASGLPGAPQALARIGLALLGASAFLPGNALVAALPAVLARRDLRRLPYVVIERGLGDRLAVVAAFLRRAA